VDSRPFCDDALVSLILGLNYELFAIMLADSRVSFSGGYSDTCLKLNLFTAAGTIGWCGDLETLEFLMERLAPISIEATDPWIVFDEQRLRTTLSIDELTACPNGIGHFIVCLIDPLKNAMGSVPQSVRMCTFGVTKTPNGYEWRHEIVPLGGYSILGSGSQIKPALDALDVEVRTWLRPLRGKINEAGVVRRCFMLEELVSGKLSKQPVQSVGGLFQMAYVLNDRVRGVSYEKWVSCGTGYGTYARMAIENGRFVQSHPPTGIRYPLFSPFRERRDIERQKGKQFLPELAALAPNDPGVIRETRRGPRSRLLSVHGPKMGESTYRPLIIPGHL